MHTCVYNIHYPNKLHVDIIAKKGEVTTEYDKNETSPGCVDVHMKISIYTSTVDTAYENYENQMLMTVVSHNTVSV